MSVVAFHRIQTCIQLTAIFLQSYIFRVEIWQPSPEKHHFAFLPPAPSSPCPGLGIWQSVDLANFADGQNKQEGAIIGLCVELGTIMQLSHNTATRPDFEVGINFLLLGRAPDQHKLKRYWNVLKKYICKNVYLPIWKEKRGHCVKFSRGQYFSNFMILIFLHQEYLFLVDHIWHHTHCLFIQLSPFVVFKTTFYNDPAL